MIKQAVTWMHYVHEKFRTGDEPVCHIALLCQIRLQSINSNFTLSRKFRRFLKKSNYDFDF